MEKQEFVRVQEFVKTGFLLLLTDVSVIFTKAVNFYKYYCLTFEKAHFQVRRLRKQKKQKQKQKKIRAIVSFM